MTTRKQLIDLLQTHRDITLPDDNPAWAQCVAIIVGAQKRQLDNLVGSATGQSGPMPSDDAVLAAITAAPGRDAGDIACSLQAETKTVSYVLRRLEALGKITVTGTHRGRRYHPAQRTAQELPVPADTDKAAPGAYDYREALARRDAERAAAAPAVEADDNVLFGGEP